MPESLLWLVNHAGTTFSLGTTKKRFKQLENTWDDSVTVKRLAASHWCAWAIGHDHRVYIYVLSSDVPIRVPETIYENQRWSPFHGFSKESLLPTDRFAWSDESGVIERPKESVRLPSAHWKWEGDWLIDENLRGEVVDREGWQYAVDFPSIYTPEKHWKSFVRKRKWIRFRRFSSTDIWARISDVEVVQISECFIDISVGGFLLPCQPAGFLSVWAVTNNGHVYARTDVNYDNPEGSSWKELNIVGQMGIINISIGASNLVWAITWDGHAVVRKEVSRNNIFGSDWLTVEYPNETTRLAQVSVGKNSVWALSREGQVWFRKGTSGEETLWNENSAFGTHWVEMVGNMSQISVSSNDQVFAIDMTSKTAYFRTGITRSDLTGKTWQPIVLHEDLSALEQQGLLSEGAVCSCGELGKCCAMHDDARHRSSTTTSSSSTIMEYEDDNKMPTFYSLSAWSHFVVDDDNAIFEQTDDPPLSTNNEQILCQVQSLSACVRASSKTNFEQDYEANIPTRTTEESCHDLSPLGSTLQICQSNESTVTFTSICDHSSDILQGASCAHLSLCTNLTNSPENTLPCDATAVCNNVSNTSENVLTFSVISLCNDVSKSSEKTLPCDVTAVCNNLSKSSENMLACNAIALCNDVSNSSEDTVINEDAVDRCNDESKSFESKLTCNAIALSNDVSKLSENMLTCNAIALSNDVSNSSEDTLPCDTAALFDNVINPSENMLTCNTIALGNDTSDASEDTVTNVNANDQCNEVKKIPEDSMSCDTTLNSSMCKLSMNIHGSSLTAVVCHGSNTTDVDELSHNTLQGPEVQSFKSMSSDLKLTILSDALSSPSERQSQEEQEKRSLRPQRKKLVASSNDDDIVFKRLKGKVKIRRKSSVSVSTEKSCVERSTSLGSQLVSLGSQVSLDTCSFSSSLTNNASSSDSTSQGSVCSAPFCHNPTSLDSTRSVPESLDPNSQPPQDLDVVDYLPPSTNYFTDIANFTGDFNMHSIPFLSLDYYSGETPLSENQDFHLTNSQESSNGPGVAEPASPANSDSMSAQADVMANGYVECSSVSEDGQQLLSLDSNSSTDDIINFATDIISEEEKSRQTLSFQPIEATEMNVERPVTSSQPSVCISTDSQVGVGDLDLSAFEFNTGQLRDNLPASELYPARKLSKYRKSPSIQALETKTEMKTMTQVLVAQPRLCWKWLDATSCVVDNPASVAWLSSSKKESEASPKVIKISQSLRDDILRKLVKRNEKEAQGFKKFELAINRTTWVKKANMQMYRYDRRQHWVPCSVEFEQGITNHSEGCLTVHYQHKKTQKHTQIPLSEMTCVRTCSDLDQPSTLNIHTAMTTIIHQPLVLKANSEVEADEWIGHLCAAKASILNMNCAISPGSIWSCTFSGDVFVSPAGYTHRKSFDLCWGQHGGHMALVETGPSGVTWGIGFDKTPHVYNNGYGGAVTYGSSAMSDNTVQITDSQHMYVYENEKWFPVVGWCCK